MRTFISNVVFISLCVSLTWSFIREPGFSVTNPSTTQYVVAAQAVEKKKKKKPVLGEQDGTLSRVIPVYKRYLGCVLLRR